MLLSKIPRSRLIAGGKQQIARCMSAHVWYRASCESIEDGIATVDAPETALGSIALSEVVEDVTYKYKNGKDSWSGMLSFASPERDFSRQESKEDSNSFQVDHHNVIMMDAPETALGSIALSEVMGESKTNMDAHWIEQITCLHDTMLAVHQPETAFGAIALSELVDKQTLYELQNLTKPLPTTMDEYHAAAEHDSRAMVVTHAEKPFHIVNVNDAWVGLCGYTPEESRNKSLAALLQGPDTNPHDLDQFMKQLQQGKPAIATITNYTKSGRKFRNRVRAGPIRNDQNIVTHFIGVLEEITEASAIKA
jgi:PAS domain S-box-containing protein